MKPTLAGALEASGVIVLAPPDAALQGRVRTLCALDGHVLGLDALARELGVEAAEGAERVVARGFERWGSGVLERLRGRFALVAWDRERARGLAAVDQLGAGALFLHDTGGSFRFASELTWLLRALPSRPGPDRSAVESWLAGGLLQRGQTLYQGVRRLPGGCCVELAEGRWQERRYWAPRHAEQLVSSRADAVDAVRQGVDRAVRRRLPPDGPAGVLLSGGIDSASVAAFAADAGAETRAYSLFFPGRPAMDESALVGTVASALGIPSTAVRFSTGSMLAASLEYLRAWEVPSASPNLALHRPLLDLVARDGVRALLDGQGGDELFGVEPYLLADRLRAGRPAHAVRLARRLPGMGEAPPRRAVVRVLREYGLEGALPAFASGEGGSWKRVRAPRWWAHRAELLTSYRERAGVHDYLRGQHGLVGLRGGHPYLDDLRLVELVLGLDPELSYDPLLDRPLLREACAGLVPDEVRLRRSKSFFDELFVETMAGPDRPALVRLLTAPDAEVSAFVGADAVRKRLDAPQRGSGWAWPLWRLATAECWLRFQTDPSFPERLSEREELAPASFTVVEPGG